MTSNQQAVMPQRVGPKPRTTPSNPHEQLEQNASAEMQEQLWNAMLALPDVAARGSGIAPPGSRALWSTADPPADREPFMVGREFVHLHPRYDGSLHMVLPPETADAAIAAGWAERHPLAGRFAPSSTVMVFGPRDERELAVVYQLVQAAHAYAQANPWLGLGRSTH
jgi:hypothetical protein